jgi:hypothetical protein
MHVHIDESGYDVAVFGSNDAGSDGIDATSALDRDNPVAVDNE